MARKCYETVTKRLAVARKLFRGRCIHTTASGRRLLVLHGDEFDAVIKHGLLSKLVGAVAYRSLLGLNRSSCSPGVRILLSGLFRTRFATPLSG